MRIQSNIGATRRTGPSSLPARRRDTGGTELRHLPHGGKGRQRNGLHDVSARVTWVVTAGSKPTQRKDAEARRDGMFDRCLPCHGNGFLEAAFDRIDGTFAATMPAQAPAGAPPYLLKPAAWPHLSPVDAAQLRQLTGH